MKDRRDAWRERLEIRAHVGDGADPNAEHSAVALCRQFHVFDEVATMDRGEVALAAVLGPLHGTPEGLREVRDKQFLGVDL